MDRPPRLPPPAGALFSGEGRPERPSPPHQSSSSFTKADPYDDPNSSMPLPTLSYPNETSTRVQFSDPSSRNFPPPNHDGGFSAGAVARKRSLVRPDRARLDENDRLWNYRNHAAAMEAEGRGVAGVSRTGHYATAGLSHDPAFQDATNLRRGKSILAREEGEANETGLSMFKRGATLRRPTNRKGTTAMAGGAYEKGQAAKAKAKREPLGPWMIFCLGLTICCPSPLLKCFGLRTKERQSAWREKMGLLAVIALSMAAVGYLTFGFTKSVCGTPANRYKSGEISTGSMIFHGYNYALDTFQHPAAAGIEGGSNPLYNTFGAAAMDGSFLFQTVNEKCLGIITPAPGTGIPTNGDRLGWYFPCNLYNQWGSTAFNKTGYADGVMCHTQSNPRSQFASFKPLGQVYYDWADIKNSSRNLGVYDGAVLDFSLLNWLDTSQVSYPPLFDQIKSGNSSYRERDITALMVNTNQRAIAACLVDTIRVGFIDSVTIGCVASDIVLYVSLVVIIGVVVIRFAMALLFGWFISWKIGRFPKETSDQRRARAAEIENWTDDIYRPAPSKYRPNVKAQKKTMLPKTSRFSKDMLKTSGGGGGGNSRPESKYGDFRKSTGPPSMYGSKSMLGAGMRNSPPGSPGGGRSSTSLPMPSVPSYSSYNFESSHSRRSSLSDGVMGACPFPLGDVVPQPPSDFEPFNYPLSHAILLITAYSESVEGLRTTLDSLATTDYPNSHKVLVVIADGMVKGAGNSLTTPEIALSMMKELVVVSDDVEALSYVAIADGHKRHNRAKVFAGFYEYDDNTVEKSKQQRVPMMLVAKVGNAAEARDAKPGNRGKRDSQVLLMGFLQKVMFDERMSAFEYEFFNSMWRCTGVSPDRFEMVLSVDADTKVFPDSVSRMISCMVHDPEIMGLCGETKIANKAETWVTMIQVFEYYVSHHLTKAFESVFGGVTCLPGCFSMYRIKAPKGGDGYWVPILANPDIVEHYSENVVDTLHKKNLLLLGEDRYLSTLMLRTFPRRKMMFCPQAVCKTVVPDTFRVLLSQRRRWINSTVHNLFELFVVPDLCGTFCFSMRFVIFMELAGTLVLPAAIAFTLYLLIITMIPGTVKPIISLILLAIILGIPGLLIVMTSRKVAYLGWMGIYLLSLPIWNLVLPLYAFLHMDDFSWGETRKIVGDTGGGHTDKDGDFDSSHIVLKRWAEFERDRRYRAGSHSRDSTYDVIQRSTSPHRSSSPRDSTISSIDTSASNGASGVPGDALLRRSSPAISNSPSQSAEGGYSGHRYPPQIELPAPLGGQALNSEASSVTRYEESTPDPNDPSVAFQRQLASRHEYPRYAEGYDSDEIERQAILSDSPIIHQQSPPLPSAATFSYPRPEREHPTAYQDSISPSTSSSAASGRTGPSSAPTTSSSDVRTSSRTLAARKARGISLVDDGPVPGSEGMRSVQRHQRRTSQGPPPSTHRSRHSIQSDLNSHSSVTSPPSGSLPPGAAPPRTSHSAARD